MALALHIRHFSTLVILFFYVSFCPSFVFACLDWVAMILFDFFFCFVQFMYSA